MYIYMLNDLVLVYVTSRPVCVYSCSQLHVCGSSCTCTQGTLHIHDIVHVTLSLSSPQPAEL